MDESVSLKSVINGIFGEYNPQDVVVRFGRSSSSPVSLSPYEDIEEFYDEESDSYYTELGSVSDASYGDVVVDVPYIVGVIIFCICLSALLTFIRRIFANE